jgi:hypothetical protein
MKMMIFFLLWFSLTSRGPSCQVSCDRVLEATVPLQGIAYPWKVLFSYLVSFCLLLQNQIIITPSLKTSALSSSLLHHK